jgi:hypothetical protein
MIEWIGNLLQKLADFFTSLWEFLKGMIEDIVTLVKLLKDWLAQIPSLFDWLPSTLLTLVILGIGVVVLYKILGREG